MKNGEKVQEYFQTLPNLKILGVTNFKHTRIESNNAMPGDN